jgi:hypothetical protein
VSSKFPCFPLVLIMVPLFLSVSFHLLYFSKDDYTSATCNHSCCLLGPKLHPRQESCITSKQWPIPDNRCETATVSEFGAYRVCSSLQLAVDAAQYYGVAASPDVGTHPFHFALLRHAACCYKPFLWRYREALRGSFVYRTWKLSIQIATANQTCVLTVGCLPY